MGWRTRLTHPHPPAPPPTSPQVLACILDGLADEAEGVRDAALAAGRIAVELYAGTALPLLLPAVEAGITSGNWRIRQSSVELLGDLLFKASGSAGRRACRPSSAGRAAPWRGGPVDANMAPRPNVPLGARAQVAGTTGKIQQDLHNEEEEGISVEAHGQAIVEALGVEKCVGWRPVPWAAPVAAGSRLLLCLSVLRRAAAGSGSCSRGHSAGRPATLPHARPPPAPGCASQAQPRAGNRVHGSLGRGVHRAHR